MESSPKRKANDASSATAGKRQKTQRQWRVPRKHEDAASAPKVIQPGDSGIWVTCNRGKEAACIGELKDLFDEYASKLYDENTIRSGTDPAIGPKSRSLPSIECEVQAEISGLQSSTTAKLFTPVNIDVQCVVFFKTIAPIEPVQFVKQICEDAAANRKIKRTRLVKRLSPMTLMGRASAEGLEKVAKAVLPAHFHQSPFQSHKFAIRPTLRNHNVLNRETIIKQVASVVGPGHEVDLKQYDLLVIVEVYKNVCGISVVDNSFEKLKRFNLAEIFDPRSDRSGGDRATQPETDTLERPANMHNDPTCTEESGDVPTSVDAAP